MRLPQHARPTGWQWQRYKAWPQQQRGVIPIVQAFSIAALLAALLVNVPTMIGAMEEMQLQPASWTLSQASDDAPVMDSVATGRIVSIWQLHSMGQVTTYFRLDNHSETFRLDDSSERVSVGERVNVDYEGHIGDVVEVQSVQKARP